MRLGLKARMFLITSFTIFLTALIVFALTQRIFNSFMQKRFLERVELLARQTASGVTLGLILRDKETLERFGRSVLREKAIVGLVVLDAQGKEFLRLGKLKEADGVVTYPIGVRSQEPFQEAKNLGYVKLYYSMAHLKGLLHKLFWQVFLVSLFLAAIIGALGYLLISKAFLTPLNDLLQAVKAVEKGNLEVQITARGLPETETLAQAFTAMVASLRESQKELERTYQEAAINRTLAEIGRFSLIIAHEIKNPLGIIKGSLDILKKEAIPPEIRKEMIAYIEDEVRRLDGLIQNFLAFARPQKINFQEINPSELLENVSRRAALEFGERKIMLETNDLPSCLFLDPEQMERALFNLIKNAFEAGAQKVTLQAREEDDHLIIEVIDNGPGIDPEIREKIFEPFFTTKSKGSGLGLAIVAQILEAHGGKILLAESKKGQTIFQIRLPKRPSREVE